MAQTDWMMTNLVKMNDICILLNVSFEVYILPLRLVLHVHSCFCDEICASFVQHTIQIISYFNNTLLINPLHSVEWSR